MSDRADPPGRWAGLAHPRLTLLVVVGAAVGLLGVTLVLAAGRGTLGLRLAVLGALAVALGGSGYVAFAVFERGFD